MVKAIFPLLDKRKKIELKVLFILIVIYFFFEFISLASIPIFVGIISDPELILNKFDRLLNISFSETYDYSQYQLFFAISVIIIFLFKNIYLVLLTIFEANFLKKFKTFISDKLFSFYTKLPYSYHLINNPSKLTKIVSDDVQNVSGYIQHTLGLVRESIALLVIFVLLFIVNWLLALTIFLLLVTVSLIYLKIIRPFLKNASEKNQLIRKGMFQTISEVFGMIKEIKIYSKENQIVDFYNKDNAKFEKNLYYFYIINKLPKVILEIFALAIIITVSLVFFNIGDDYTKHFPTLALLTVATIRFIPAFNGIVTALSYLKIFQVSLNLISKEIKEMELLAIENLNVINPESNIRSEKNHYLQIKNLYFRYPNKDDYLIKDVNFRIDKGAKIAITGETGSGKSTLTHLILGLFSPESGDILFENKSIFENIMHWRKKLGYVPQKTYLLDSTIEKNIAFNFINEDIDKSKMEKAIHIANLSQKINDLPRGLKTKVGSDGIRFSGGEKQRIAIARAIYQDPEIIIMDEFTSSLDLDTENKILSLLSDFLKNKTSIIVSHRLNTIKNCDTVFHLNDKKLTKKK